MAWLLSTTTRNQAFHGGLERDAEQLIPEQFTVVRLCCRDAEPRLRSSEQLRLPDASPDEHSATETERDEANSGTNNLRHKRLDLVLLLRMEEERKSRKTETCVARITLGVRVCRGLRSESGGLRSVTRACPPLS